MQTSMIILLVGALQLALLIIVVYMVVTLRMYYNVRYSIVDILLLAAQTANLIVLLQYFSLYEEIADSTIGMFAAINPGNTGFVAWLITIQGIIIFALLLRFAWLLRKLWKHRKRLIKSRSIRETVNYLPGGLCFAAPNGRPVLTNRKMNELVYRLTGHTIMDAKLVWDELCTFSSANGCFKLDDPWINREYLAEAPGNGAYFLLPDNSVWRFKLEELTDSNPHYIQLEATDISELYGYSRELFENNQRLAAQYERQQRLLANIVEINHEKEILSMKMRIHDDLGRSILKTKQHLSNGTLSENIPTLAEVWNNTIRCLEDYTQIYADSGNLPENELQKAADMIGCRICYYGERPTGHKTALLFYAAVREALTNAVRHAAADELFVSIQRTSSEYKTPQTDQAVKGNQTPGGRQLTQENSGQ